MMMIIKGNEEDEAADDGRELRKAQGEEMAKLLLGLELGRHHVQLTGKQVKVREVGIDWKDLWAAGKKGQRWRDRVWGEHWARPAKE